MSRQRCPDCGSTDTGWPIAAVTKRALFVSIAQNCDLVLRSRTGLFLSDDYMAAAPLHCFDCEARVSEVMARSIEGGGALP